MHKTKGFNKKEFQTFWGEDGYIENFSYGVGIETVCNVCLYPFIKGNVLEIGSGGGTFTKRIKANLTAIDVIKKPKLFDSLGLNYIELGDRDYKCTGVESGSIDFAFSYGVFCHLPNHALIEYLQSVNRVLKTGGDFVFMLSEYSRYKPYSMKFKFGEMTSRGHYYQNLKTVRLIVGEGWKIVNVDMIPEHRERMIHIKKL